ncbi:CBS domain-containing protein [candidate division KSB1 bacterium]
MLTRTARDIMTRDVVTVTEDMKIFSVIELLNEKKISGVPVVDKNDNLVGIVTKSDLLGNFIDQDIELSLNLSISLKDALGFQEPEKTEEKISVHEFEVKEVMSAESITATEDTPIEKLAEMMIDAKIHRIVIVDDNSISGIVSTHDMLYHLCGGKKNG